MFKIKHVTVLIREIRKLSAQPDAHRTVEAIKELILTIMALFLVPAAIALWVYLIKSEVLF